MRIHGIQTGSVAVRSRQRRGAGPGPLRLAATLADRQWTEPLPILAWVIEHPEGLIVVDTGETSRASQRGYFPAWHPYFRLGVREWVEPEEEIGPRMRRLGLSPADARWVVLTHLHTDHAGGLGHFPGSEILVSRRELELASGLAGSLRGYLPQRWPAWFAPTPVDFSGRPFGPFEYTVPLTEAGDVMLVATPGHTPGHMSVLVRLEGRLVMLAGDSSYTQALMLEGAADGVTGDEALARETLRSIRAIAEQQPTVYLPSHDPESLGRLARMEPAMAVHPTRAEEPALV